MKAALKSVLKAIALTSALSGPALAQSSWMSISPMPTARWVPSAATGGDGKIYVLGGSPVARDAFPINVVEAYDPTTKVWTRQADLSIARSPASAMGHDGKIYAFGGWIGGSCYTDLVEVYDPSTDCWTPRVAMPTPRLGLAAVTGLDGRIYAIGGSQGGDDGRFVVDVVEVYDPISDSWTTAAPMPTRRSALGAALGADGRIYAIGGRDPNRSYFLTEVQAYDPATNCWTTVASMPTGRYNLGVVAGEDGRIYAFGGFASGYVYSNTVEAYDPATNQWSRAPSMLVARESPGAARGLDGKIYAIGGLTVQIEPTDSGEFLLP